MVEQLRLGDHVCWTVDDNRAEAACCLGCLCSVSREKVADLVKALKDRGALVRRRAVEALGRMGPDAAAAREALQDRQKNDDDPQVRSLAADALKQVEGKKEK